MIFGKTIQLFLLDGTPNGRWICELSNWTGVAYKIPRNLVKESESRTELASPGIYFLFGQDEVKERPLIYIGESENTISRLKQHLSEKDNWNEVVAFISKGSKLNKAHIKFLENSFHAIALECNRYTVDNSSVPTKSSISEAEQAELEEFIHNAKILVNALGHKVFEPYIESTLKSDAVDKTFYIPSAKGKAMGILTSDGFVLLKGSVIHKISGGSLSPGIRKKIAESRENGEIIDDILQNDKHFSSSSAAAAFAVGHSISGPQCWVTENGKSLKFIEAAGKN